MTHSYMRHDSFICVPWLIHMCAMTHSYVWHDSFIFMTWLIHVCHDSFICVTWRILMYAMTNFNVWHDAFRCVTRLYIHKSDSPERKKERKNKDKDPPTARDSISTWNMQQMLPYSICWYKSDSPVLNMTRFEYAANVTAANVTTLLATLMFAHLFRYSLIRLAGTNMTSWTWLFHIMFVPAMNMTLSYMKWLRIHSTCRSKFNIRVLNLTLLKSHSFMYRIITHCFNLQVQIPHPGTERDSIHWYIGASTNLLNLQVQIRHPSTARERGLLD